MTGERCSRMGAVYKKELKSFFNSPIAYVINGLFILGLGIYFYYWNLALAMPDFGVTLQIGGYLMIIFAPIITMKLLAEEKKNRTEVLLMTSPTPVTSIVLGKYFAAVTVFLAMIVSTFIFPVILMFYVDDMALFPWASLIGNYVAFILMGLLFLAIGLLASSFSDSQVLSAVVGIVSLFILWVIGQLGLFTGGVIGKIATWVSPLTRFENFAKGLLSISSIVFYLTFTAVILFVTIINTERRRWSQG